MIIFFTETGRIRVNVPKCCALEGRFISLTVYLTRYPTLPVTLS